MKKLQVFVLLLVVVVFNACTSEPERKFTIQNSDFYELDTAKSSVTWDRFVDNKLIKKTVKLFGANVDVNMENVTFNTTGTTPVNSGSLKYINNEMAEGNLEMNFSVCRFYSDEEKSFFVVKDFPPSVLKFLKAEKDSLNPGKFILSANLSLRDSSKNIQLPVEIKTDSLKNIQLTGTYVMQTLDWPIRENPDRNNIRKDEITFKFDLSYRFTKSVADTIYETTKP